MRRHTIIIRSLIFSLITATISFSGIAISQAYRGAAAREAADRNEGFYEELSDDEPDADDARAWLSNKPDWDYKNYGPNRGTYSPRRYNYGPYNYLPEDPLGTSPYQLEDTYDGWDVLDDELEDRRYWYEIHDNEPDRDDYLYLQRYGNRRPTVPNWRDDPVGELRYEPYIDELTPRDEEREDWDDETGDPRPAARPPRSAPARRVPSARVTQNRDDLEFAPEAAEVMDESFARDRRRAGRTRTHRGRVVDMTTVLVADARPQGLVLTIERADRGENAPCTSRVFFTGQERVAMNRRIWLWPQDDQLTVSGDWVEVKGRRVLQAQHVAQAENDRDQQRARNAQRSFTGQINGLWSASVRGNQVQAVLLRFETQEGESVPVLLGSRETLMQDAGALISPDEKIEVVGSRRRIDRTPLIFAQQATVLGSASRRSTQRATSRRNGP